MKKQIEPKYKMATTALHLTGDISREDVDICIVYEEDDDNFYGNWICGFGFVGVAFPKATTRDLTPEEVEKYHGQPTMLAGGFGPTINITGEDFHKHVVVTKEGGGKVHSGTLVCPIKVGGVIAMTTDGGRTWTTSAIQSIDRNVIKTRNSTYMVDYL
jgi:hypothetical protein